MKKIIGKALLVILLITSTVLTGCDFNSTENYSISVAANNANYGYAYGAGTYAEGTEVTLVAVAKQGYEFVNWGGDTTKTSSNIIVTIENNEHYIAFFQPIEEVNIYTLQSVVLSATNFSGNNSSVDLGLYRLNIDYAQNEILKYETAAKLVSEHEYRLQFGLYDQMLYALNNAGNNFTELESGQNLSITIDDFRFTYYLETSNMTEVVLDSSIDLTLQQVGNNFEASALLFEDASIDVKIMITFNFELI